MKLVAILLAVLLVGCSAPGSPSAEPSSSAADRTWLGMVPGDALAFEGPRGELVLIYVDETYDMRNGVYASALTWKLGEDEYTTDYFVEDDDGALWWYGRRGSWRAGRHGEEPRRLTIVDHRVRFGDRAITLSDDDGPVQLETPDGVYRR